MAADLASGVLGLTALSVLSFVGGRTIRSPEPMHGKTSRIHHQGKALFAGMPSPFTAARYHSLAVQPSASALARRLRITGQTADGTIMGLSHQHLPLHGVQFHPESFMTEHGFTLIENFLRLGPLNKKLDQQPSHVPVNATLDGVTNPARVLEARAC